MKGYEIKKKDDTMEWAKDLVKNLFTMSPEEFKESMNDDDYSAALPNKKPVKRLPKKASSKKNV